MPLFQPKNHVLLAEQQEYVDKLNNTEFLSEDYLLATNSYVLIFGPCYIPQEIKEMRK